MAKRPILKLCYFIATLPYILLSKVAFKLNLWGFKKDVASCFEKLEKFEQVQLSNELLNTLVVAEDHRHRYHFGIDQIAFCRAIFCTLMGSIQGASTIEQQFVRVATNRYQRTIKRKLFEQMLAVFVSSSINKECIATAYLCIAYYGKNTPTALGIKNTDVKYAEAIPIISRLKYPEPSMKSDKWLIKFKNRNNHISYLLSTANKSFKRTKNSWLLFVPHKL